MKFVKLIAGVLLATLVSVVHAEEFEPVVMEGGLSAWYGENFSQVRRARSSYQEPFNWYGWTVTDDFDDSVELFIGSQPNWEYISIQVSCDQGKDDEDKWWLWFKWEENFITKRATVTYRFDDQPPVESSWAAGGWRHDRGYTFKSITESSASFFRALVSADELKVKASSEYGFGRTTYSDLEGFASLVTSDEVSAVCKFPEAWLTEETQQ